MAKSEKARPSSRFAVIFFYNFPTKYTDYIKSLALLSSER
jgi:hypothetical protein